MIDAITPLVLHTVAQAGGPLTISGLMDRLRSSLADAALHQHIRDLVHGGQLRADAVNDGHTLTVALPEGATLPPLHATWFKGAADHVPQPRRPRQRLPLRHQRDLISRQLVEGATRDGRRPRSSPRRALVLALIDQQPMTAIDIGAALDNGRCAIGDHLRELQRRGLAMHYAMTRNEQGLPIPLWVSARLRPSLPGPPPMPPRPALVRRQKASIEHRSNTAHTEERA